MVGRTRDIVGADLVASPVDQILQPRAHRPKQRLQQPTAAPLLLLLDACQCRIARRLWAVRTNSTAKEQHVSWAHTSCVRQLSFTCRLLRGSCLHASGRTRHLVRGSMSQSISRAFVPKSHLLPRLFPHCTTTTIRRVRCCAGCCNLIPALHSHSTHAGGGSGA